jgi:2-polyprenyl-3-methyl-5-hydroxy-6-metoxy-1,4-benzoquinol methylase
MATPDGDSTIAAYEECAIDYAHSTRPDANLCATPGLRELLRIVRKDLPVLEVGSGPGWDADWLEASGLDVRRTDATTAFVKFQRDRGKSAERLNLLEDDLGGPYAAIVAMYVFQHIDRRALPTVLEKAARAVAPDGLVLFSTREGEGEALEQRASGGRYYVALWSAEELDAIASSLGLETLWSRSSVDSEGAWRFLLLRLRTAV